MTLHHPHSVAALYDVIVLDGQGTGAATSPQTISLALRDAQSPLGAAILVACHHAFLFDHSFLSQEELRALALDLSELDTPEALLTSALPARPNAVLANTSLYLIQLLRFVTHLDPSDPFPASSPSAGDRQYALLGFSTGVFAAAVIASARSVPTLVSYAVEAFRLAFWLGLRAQQYALASLSLLPPSSVIPHDAPWSLVVFGSSRQELKQAVDRFAIENPQHPSVHLTAVTHLTCVSISGRPDALVVFQKRYLPSTASISRFAPIHTLYHAPNLAQVREQVISDVKTKNIRFPSYASLHHSLCSTATGEWITSSSSGDPNGSNGSSATSSLVQDVIDMTLLHPVNFDIVTDTVARDFAATRTARLKLINLGPGNALSRAVARSISDLRVDSLDWASSGAQLAPPLAPSLKSRQQQDAIAIVGMAVKFPGANDASGLWEVLERGLNTISEIPESRFNVSDYTSQAGSSKRSMKARFGNFIEDPDAFDNAFFRISPREARSMDPQQRLLLQVSYHALEHAGYVPNSTESFNPDTFGTYVGVATNDYLQNLRNHVDVYYSTGTLQAFLSGKISYAFGFSGPSIVVDTACSSSMVAVYQACRALNNGDCNAAVAGGVNVISSPDMYMGLDRAHFLSSTGQCKPWDASADGYSRAEGCGMFVLKRLSDALAENDNILGVIRGIAVNQSANAESITQPHVPTQISLFEKLMSATGVDPSQVSVVEAHGTGTKAGDPTEIQSIRTVFARNRTVDNPLHLTSIKANIGHAEAASGAASLAKLLLMMKHRAIPPVISLKQLNPRISDLSQDGTRIDTEFVPWPTPCGPSQQRLALLNNFGAAGSNAALLLEESPYRPSSTGSSPSSLANAFVVGISCESEEAAEKLRSAFIRRIDEGGDSPTSLSDLSYTATARRQLHTYRLAASGRTKEELVEGLRNVQLVHVNEARGKTVFLFSGQGGQYVGMGARLYHTLPPFRQIVDECHCKLVSWGFSGVLDVIAPADGADRDCDTQAFQSAVFVLEFALSSLWMSWGIVPDAVAGHSLGEYAALVAAGVISLDDGLRLVAGRARLMIQKCAQQQTGMLAVKASSTSISQMIRCKGKFDTLSIACYNSSADCVVAGSLAQLKVLQGELKASGTKCASVNVPFAYHTAAMAPIYEDIVALANDVPLAPPSIPILSNVHGNMVSVGEANIFNAEYFARHCREPVKFEQCMQDLLAHPDFTTVTTWIEIGPHPTTLPMLRSMPSTSQQALYLPSLRKNTDDWQTLSASLASLYCTSSPLQWRKVFADLCPGASLTELPAYPFADTRYWIAFEEETPRIAQASAPVTPPKFSLIDSCVNMPPVGSKDPAIFETPISKVAHLIEGHKVSGFGLCPASVYVEMASAAAQLVLEQAGAMVAGTLIKLGDITFANPLVYSPDVPRTIRIEIGASAPGTLHTGTFEISSYPTDHSGKGQVHCSGVFDKGSAASSTSKLALSSTMVQRRKKAVTQNADSETFHTRTAYNVIFSRVVAYSSLYHTMKTITVDSDGNDAYAVVTLPEASTAGEYVVNPIFMDTLLHAAGFLINLNAGDNEAFICAQVDKINVVPELVKNDATYGVYCSIGMLSDSTAVADAYAIELGQGTIVAHMKRMHFRRLRTAGFKSLLSSAVSRSTVVPSVSGASTPASADTGVTLLEQDPPQGGNGSAADSIALMGKIKETMGSVLDMSPKMLGEDQELERFGLDSLTSIEAHHALCTTLNVSLPDNLFLSAKTIRDLYENVSRCTVSQALRAEIKATLFHRPVSLSPSTPVCPPATTAFLKQHQQQQAQPQHSGSVAASTVKQIMASVLDMPVHDLREDAELERLGLDSLTSIEAHHELCKALNVDLPADILLTCKTIRDLQTAISPPVLASVPAPVLVPVSVSVPTPAPLPVPALSRLRVAASSPTLVAETYGTEINPVAIQNATPSNRNAPLFLIHDGGGLASQYKRLPSLDRPVYGIHNPRFTTGGRWEGGIIEMARCYCELIKKELGDRTECLLGGWSVGGVLAFETSKQLIQAGFTVSGLVLIDSPFPQTTCTLTDSVIDAVFSSKGKAPSKLRDLARTNIKSLTRSLVDYDYNASPANHVRAPKAVMLACNQGITPPTTSTTVHNERHSIGSTTWLADRRDLSKMVVEWEEAVGGKIPVLDIPGNHFEVFEPQNIPQVSKRLQEALTLLC